MTTALLPRRSPSVSRSMIMQPSGVQGTRPCRPTARRPALADAEAVDVFVRIDGRLDQNRVDVVGHREPHQDAMDERIGVQGGDKGQEVGLAGLRGQFVGHRMHAARRGLLTLTAHIDFAAGVRADQDDGRPAAGHDRASASATSAMTCSRTLSATARTLPSMICASLMGGSLRPGATPSHRRRRSYAPAARGCNLFLAQGRRGGREGGDPGLQSPALTASGGATHPPPTQSTFGSAR